MFTVGQIVYTKVLDKCNGDKDEILLSLLPSDVNSEISSGALVEGNTIQCAVEELEDHGYLMETGIANVKAFLPKNNIKTEPANGEIIYCKVQSTPSANTIILSAFKKNEMIKISTADVPNLKALFPGTVVDFNIVKVLKNGIEGLLFDGSVSAYANEMYVPTKLSVKDDSNIGKAVKARILYTMPLSNQIFVTLNVDEVINHKKEILFGTVVKNAKVMSQSSGGVVFKLDGNRKAFLPRRSIVKNLKNNFDAETALVKYSPNTQHDIRVMDYNDFEDCYLCTNNEKMLSEKYFSTYDLKVGEIIMAKIVEKFKSGIRISIGNIRGYLIGAFYHKISKIEAGKEIRVRVVEVDHDSKHIQVTNLSGFLKKENVKIMDDRSKIKVGESYTGLILKDTPRAINILFFNHNKGMLLKTASFESDVISIGGFKENTVRNFEVASVKKDKILLRIPNVKISTNLGTIVDAQVSAVLPNSIQIFVNELKAYGKIPIDFISEISSYRELMMSAIKEKSTLKVVALSNNQYSLRDVNYYSNDAVKTDFNDVEVDDVLRCFVKSINDENVLLDCPLKNFSQTIRLNRNAFSSSDDLSFIAGDVIYVSVIAKNESHNNSLYVTPELNKVWKNDSDALSLLESYLKDTNFLLQHLKESEKPLGKYSIGQRVSGKVKTIIGNNLVIEFDDGVYAQGSVDNVSYKIGTEIKEAVVVWIDPINQMLFVTVKEKCKDEISIDQVASEKDVTPKKHKAIVVYFNEYVTVCTVRKAGQPLVFVPSKHHYNDFSSSLNSKALGNASSKLIIKKLTEGKLLGTFIQDGKIFKKLEKLKNKLEKKFVNKKRQHTDSISTIDDDERKRHKVVLDADSEDDDDEVNEVKETPEVVVEVAANKSKSLQSFSKKNKELGKTFKSFIQQSKKGLGKVPNKDSLVDENLVSLTSYKNAKGVSVGGKKLQKPMKKSTIGMKTKKPKRLIKKK